LFHFPPKRENKNVPKFPFLKEITLKILKTKMKNKEYIPDPATQISNGIITVFLPT